MNIQLNLSKLINSKISAQQVIFCILLHNGNEELLYQYFEIFELNIEDINYLIDNGWIKRIDDGEYAHKNFEVSKKFISKFVPKQVINVEEWIDEWRDLFPRGARIAGYSVRSDRPGCIYKMTKFLKEHKDFNKDMVIEATKSYIKKMSSSGFERIRTASNFIEKNKESILAAEIEYLELNKGGEDEKFIDDI